VLRTAIAALLLMVALRANGEPLPPGAIGLVGGITAGVGADNHNIGYGFYGIDNIGFLFPLPSIVRV